MNCEICKEEIKKNAVIYSKDGKDYHRFCTEKEILVYSCQMENGPAYFENGIEGIQAILENMDIDDKFIIGREKMSQLKYDNLPEFEGF